MEYREREIDLIDILWKIAFAWRQCLIVAVICAILLPGFMYIRGLRGYNASMAQKVQQQTSAVTLTKEEQREKALSGLTEDEAEAVESALLLTEDYEAAVAYVDAAPAMQIDPYNEEAVVIEYYIDYDRASDENGVIASSLVSAYDNLITEGIVAQAVTASEETSYLAPYIQDLVNVDLTSGGNVITVIVIAPDSAFRDRIAAAVTDTFNINRENIAQVIGSHSISVLGEHYVNRIDSDLLSLQSDAKSRVTKGKTDLDTAKKALSDKQKTALTSLLAIDKADAASDTPEGGEEVQTSDGTAEGQTTGASSDNQDAAETTTASKPSFSLKYAAVGFLAGIILVAIVIVLIDIFSKKLNYETELKDIFGVDTYAVFRREKNYKGIDAWLYNLRYKNRRILTEDEAIRSLVTNISLLMKGRERTLLFMTGTKINAMDEKIKADIIASLKDSGIEVEVGDNVCFDNDSLVKADETGVVLITEQLAGSSIEDIAHELTAFREHDIEVVGGVIFES